MLSQSVTGPVNRAVRRVPGWAFYVVSVAYAAWLFWQALTGAIGVDPVNLLERAYGEAALWCLVASLAVTPLRERLRLNFLPWRRALGVSCFGFALAHLLVFTLLDLQSVSRLWVEIVERPYITVGMISFVLLLPLALTSNNLAIRRMGGMAWRNLHKLVYPAAILVALHYIWLTRGFQLGPVLWSLSLVGLVALRFLPKRRAAAA